MHRSAVAWVDEKKSSWRILDGGGGASARGDAGPAVDPALHSVPGMRTVAGLAMVCLLTAKSGCSWVVQKRSKASVIADVTLGTAALLVVNNQRCKMTGTHDQCEAGGLAMVVFGAPLVLVGATSGGFALAWDRDAEAQPQLEEQATPGVSGPLPLIPTDPVTLQLARQARAAAVSGQCAAARTTMDKIAARDADYHTAMLVKGVLGACR